MPNKVSAGPAVTGRVRSLLPVGVIAAHPPLLPLPLVLATSWLWRALPWLARVVLEVVREELVATSYLRTAFLLVAALAMLSRALSLESRRPVY